MSSPAGRLACRSTGPHYLDSESTGLCSYSLMLRAQRRSSKYQVYNLLVDPPMIMKNSDLIRGVSLEGIN